MSHYDDDFYNYYGYRQPMSHDFRRDEYRLGDLVEFGEVDEFNQDIINDGIERMGPGPYRVEKVTPVDPRSWGSVAHTQHLLVNGHYYSGYWFKPIDRSVTNE